MMEDILSLPVSSIKLAPKEEALPEGGRLSFSKVNPKLQIAWDSVSLGAAKTCPRKYQLSIVEGWQGRGSNIHLRFGQLYHRVLEYYDHMRFAEKSHDESMVLALRDLAEGCIDTLPDGSRVWWNPEEFLSEDQAAKNTKTIPNLFRSAIWYMDKFQNDTCKTVRLHNGKPAVELSFRYELGYEFRTGESMLHCGHLDRLVELSDDHYVLDRKTTKNTITGNSSWGYFAKYSPDNQMTGYTFAGKLALAKPVKGVIIDAVQIAKGFSRFERGFTLRTDAQLEEWRFDTLTIVSQFEVYAERGYWPMNDTACDHYGGCPFRGICSKDPSVREAFLRADFTKRPWDPLQVRGDI